MYKQELPIILASKSPRRHELLKLMGLDFTIELKEVDESYPPHLAPAEIALHIAEQKAKAFGNIPGKIVITADTIVALNGEILGKPNDREHAKTMLKKLAGNRHEVFTAVALVNEKKTHTFCEVTEVVCRDANEEEIEFYIDNFQPYDKAGSYGIQDYWGVAVVKLLNGSYTNVMGLPTERLLSELKGF
ncbi:MAG: septum formation protein Maf [Pedobacter sp.]|nr:MAG: septum formation protein Maf [Pedobacter sp.]